MHDRAFEFLNSLEGGHFRLRLVPMTECYLVKFFNARLSIYYELQPPLAVVLIPRYLLYQGVEYNILLHIIMCRIRLDILLKLCLRQVMRVL